MKNIQANTARQNFINSNINLERVQIKTQVAKFDATLFIGSVYDVKVKMDSYFSELNSKFGENLIIENEYNGHSLSPVVLSTRYENDTEYNIRIEQEKKSAINKLLTVITFLTEKQLYGKVLTKQEKNLLLDC